MARRADHEQQASRNRDFYEELGAEKTARPEWAMTALFYTAVHDVQVVIIRKGWKFQTKNGSWRFPRDHHERLAIIKRECPQIAADYRALQQWSEAARYECRPFGRADLQLAKRTLDGIAVELARIT
jgi:hypothetical protein